MKDDKLNVGDLVKSKSVQELYKIGYKIPKDRSFVPYMADVGIVIQVLYDKKNEEDYVVIRWQKLNIESAHYVKTLHKIV